MKASLFVFVMVLLMPAIYAQKREIQSVTKKEERDFAGHTWYVPVTYHYYYDNDDNEVKHGVSTAKLYTKETGSPSSFSETINYVDGNRHGSYSRTIEYTTRAKKNARLKITGEYKNDKMSGNWTFNSVIGNERRNATFSVKDGVVVKFSDGSTSFSVDANGKASLSGKPYISGKNNVITGAMYDKTGNVVAASPKAKALTDAMLKREVPTKECVESGFYVSSTMIGKDGDWLHGNGLGGSHFGFYDTKDLEFPKFTILHQIGDREWLSYSECIDKLNEKKGNADEFAKLVNDLLDDNYCCRIHIDRNYIDANTARQIEQYVANYLSTSGNNIKQTIQRSNKLTDLVSYMNSQGNIISLLDKDAKQSIETTYNAKVAELQTKEAAEIKNAVKSKTDIIALTDYYRNSAQPVMSYLLQNDVDAIESLYASKSAELQKAASLRIKDEMLQKQSTKELKQYYEGQKSTISLLPDASSIKTEYENTYNKLQKVEEEAAKKAARKQKIITGVKWVGGAAVIVGGYILAKRYGFFDK